MQQVEVEDSQLCDELVCLNMVALDTAVTSRVKQTPIFKVTSAHDHRDDHKWQGRSERKRKTDGLTSQPNRIRSDAASCIRGQT